MLNKYSKLNLKKYLMTTTDEPSGNRIYIWIGFLIILLSVKLFPNLPDSTLDSSWMNGLNVALEKGAIPGVDLVFTYGPLANMLTGYLGHGFLIGLILSLAVAFNFALFLRVSTGPKFIAAAIVFFLLVPTNEAIFYCYLVFFPFAAIQSENAPTLGRASILLSAVLMSTLILSKLSFLPIVLILVALYCCLEIYKKNYLFCFVFITCFSFAVVLMWLIGGQDLINLPNYLFNGEIINGYTSAMEWDLGVNIAGINLQLVEAVLLYGFSSVILWSIFRTEHNTPYTLYKILSVGVVLAIVIKGAVVRHGGVHSIYPWILLCLLSSMFTKTPIIFSIRNGLFITIILITIILSPFYSGDGRALAQVVSGARDNAKSLGIEWQDVKRSPGYWGVYIMNSPDTFFNSISNPASGLAERVNNISNVFSFLASNGKSLNDSVNQSREKTKQECPLAIINGSVDIYPTNINCLLVHGMEWKQRPVFQSYSAYTPELLNMNRAHITGPTAPDSIFIAINPIDGRFPALEEGSNWTCLAMQYQPRGLIQGGYLQLIHTGGNCLTEKENKKLDVHLGESVELSCEESNILAGFNFRQTVVGKLASLLYKTRRLVIDVRTCDGSMFSYKFVPGMAILPIPLSPLVENAEELRDFMFGTHSKQDRRISSFVIKYGDSESPIREWTDVYTVRFY